VPAAIARRFSLLKDSPRPLPVPTSSRIHAELIFEAKVIEPEFAGARRAIHTFANN